MYQLLLARGLLLPYSGPCASSVLRQRSAVRDVSATVHERVVCVSLCGSLLCYVMLRYVCVCVCVSSISHEPQALAVSPPGRSI